MENYDIKDRIGQGQFSKVYSAIHKPSSTLVALKLVQKPVMSLQKPTDKKKGAVQKAANADGNSAGYPHSGDFISLDTLKQEVKCQRGLKHENILRLLACFETAKDIVFVTELCKGDLLQVLRKEGKFAEVDVKGVAMQLVPALKYIHDLNIIHRDLKLQV